MTNIVQEQIEYYAARAQEYDDWFYRADRYDRGDEATQAWLNEVAELRHRLLLTGRHQRVLELACGTGLWTRELLSSADHITAVDSSREMIAINRARLRTNPKVTYHRADIFSWEPTETYDMVFAGFWLSHVPPDRFDALMTMIKKALTPGGRLFAIDSLREPMSTAGDHSLAPPDSIFQLRRLHDGREFNVVKVFFETETLQDRLDVAGFDAEVHRTRTYFWYTDARKR